MPLGETLTRVVDGEETFIYVCSECSYEHSYEDEAMDCCMFYCENCGDAYESQGDADNCCSYTCEFCGQHYSSEEWAGTCCEGERERRELLNPDYPPTAETAEVEHSVFVPVLEGRPARLVSIEQELSRGGAAVARLLNRLGMSQYDRIVNYSNDGYPGQAIVKEDGSLPTGGGEVVYSRFDLSTPRDMQNLSKALASIRWLEGEGIVGIDERAGTHIHLSALDFDRKAFGPAQIAALYEIFSFSEDVVFRMGAAGWPNHRGTEYTRILPKHNKDEKLGVTPSKIAKQTQRERYYSLNFRRLLNAVQGCRCGACIVGDWDGCDCDVMDVGTVEWRVFNATTDPEILHSWLLLAHGMTGASFTHTLGTLEPHDYNATDPALHPWIFGWLLWNCPFEDSERQIIFNTARNAPGLNLPWENIDVFHAGWESMEVPEATEVPLLPDPFDPPVQDFEVYDEDYNEDVGPTQEEDDAFYLESTCNCSDCTTRREQALRRQQANVVTDAFNSWTASLGNWQTVSQVLNNVDFNAGTIRITNDDGEETFNWTQE
jgi:hypothetical protein